MIDNLSSSSGREPQIEELVTCRLERAKARENLNEQTDARAAYDQAILLATRRYGRTSRADAGEAMIEAQRALAQYLVRQNDLSGAEAEYGGRDRRNRKQYTEQPHLLLPVLPIPALLGSRRFRCKKIIYCSECIAIIPVLVADFEPLAG